MTNPTLREFAEEWKGPNCPEGFVPIHRVGDLLNDYLEVFRAQILAECWRANGFDPITGKAIEK